MKKIILSFVLVLAALSFSTHAFAAGSNNSDCPLKNLKKNQLRGPDGTAFYPASMHIDKKDLDLTKVGRSN